MRKEGRRTTEKPAGRTRDGPKLQLELTPGMQKTAIGDGARNGEGGRDAGIQGGRQRPLLADGWGFWAGCLHTGLFSGTWAWTGCGSGWAGWEEH